MDIDPHRSGVLKPIRLPLQAVIVGLFLGSGGLLAQTLPVSRNLINFNSVEGEELLIESQVRQDYFPLSIQFITQKNQAYCGVASIVMVLNALSIPAPEAPEFGKYHVFTQDNFLMKKLNKLSLLKFWHAYPRFLTFPLQSNTQLDESPRKRGNLNSEHHEGNGIIWCPA